MNKEELEKIFDWLEENMNMRNWFDFKLTDRNQISAYWKNTNKIFAVYYVNVIKNILKGGNGVKGRS
ncbi:MAG: hypothetical protein IJ501_06665 [Bacilli bacterium]|nr:hypothetical protein [Bacilli bacterium]